jgi:hypothetical protein
MTMAGPSFFQSFDQGEYDPENDDVPYVDSKELESIPFSWRSAKWKIEIMRYSMRMGIDRYANPDWPDQIRNQLGRWSREDIPTVDESKLDLKQAKLV